MTKRHALILCAVMVVAGALILSMWFGGALRSSPKAPPSPGQGTAWVLTESAKFITPSDVAEVPSIVATFSEACQAACAQLSTNHAFDGAGYGRLCDAATERLQLYLDPSYEKYREYSQRLSGRDPRGLTVMNIMGDEKSWAIAEDDLRLLPLDPDAVHVRALFIRGRDVSEPISSGGYGFRSDSGKYFSNVGDNPTAMRATVYEVMVPVLVQELFPPNERAPLVLGMAFVLDESTGAWKPWRMSYHSPVKDDRVYPTPWL